jgi:hypothetical protein
MKTANINTYITIPCQKCGRLVDNCGENTKKATCSHCVLSVCGMPESPTSTYKPTGRPAGWHWMKEYVDTDGNVFRMGKEQRKLFGTLPPTKVKPKKITKRRTQEQILLAMDAERKTELKKAHQKQKDFINHNIQKDV